MTPTDPNDTPLRDRASLTLMRGGSGLALWALVDIRSDPGIPGALYLAVVAWVAVTSAVALALSGPVRPIRALGVAAGLGALVSALISAAALRFAAPLEVLEDPGGLSMMFVFVVVATPFLAAVLQDRRGWHDYGALFDGSWTIVVRYALGWAFAGLVVLVLFLSDTLLGLVGVTAIDLLLRTDWALTIFVGATLGLGLAVVHEMRAHLSPHLLLRLLRLLVPAVLAVVAVFLVALPMRGLSDMFGSLSAGATLMATAALAITLVTVALDRDGAHEVRHPVMRAAAQGLAVLAPVLGALAVWAVVLRVGQYGWTPQRVFAGIVSGVILIQSLGHMGAVVLRRSWAARIRQINVVMALAVLGVTAVWMTPLLNALRISTNSQVARYEAGRGDVSDLPLWEMKSEWGRAGQAGIATLTALAELPEHADLAARMQDLADSDVEWKFNQSDRTAQRQAQNARVSDLLVLRPDPDSLPPGALDMLPDYVLGALDRGCGLQTPLGRAGCVALVAPFAPEDLGWQQVMVFYLESNTRTAVSVVTLNRTAPGEPQISGTYDIRNGIFPQLDGSVVDAVLDGDYTLRPAGQALELGDKLLVPDY